MVNTTALTLQQCADLAGTRTTLYPEQVAPPTVHACRQCGTPLNGERSRNTQALRVFCGRQCMTAYNRRTARTEDAEAFGLGAYSW